MKVIIIGAGIAGLTCALACQRHGIDVKLYDKAKQLANIGGGILLWPQSLRYLEWMELTHFLKPHYVHVKGCRIGMIGTGTQGQKTFSEDYTPFYTLLGGEIFPIDRSLFQQNLVMQLADNVLELNKHCIDIKHSPDRACVVFADGSEEYADVIIGADGIHSNVRKSFNKCDPQYTNNCWWGGIIEQKHAPSLAADEVFVAIGKSKACIVWPLSRERFMWYLPVKMSPTNLMDTHLQTICANWSVEVEEVINAPTSAQNFRMPIYTLPPQMQWSNSRITLIGDAAHALGPILGQGANQAIEDAFVLVQCLKNGSNDIPMLLKRYEAFRHQKSQRIFELENQSAAMMVSDDIAALETFQEQVQHLNLASIYQDLIPLVDEKARVTLISALAEV